MRFAYLISIRNVRRPGAANGPYRVADKGRGFFEVAPNGAEPGERESNRDQLSRWRIFNKIFLSLNILAMARAPIAALWDGGILQRRSDAYKAKLSIFATLVGLATHHCRPSWSGRSGLACLRAGPMVRNLFPPVRSLSQQWIEDAGGQRHGFYGGLWMDWDVRRDG
jgi:hypothetical protein